MHEKQSKDVEVEVEDVEVGGRRSEPKQGG